eukprot:11813260-Alexandrium_andersonii.AAC.1
MAALAPCTAAQVVKAAAHPVPALPALQRPAALLVWAAAATAALAARGEALALLAPASTRPRPWF